MHIVTGVVALKRPSFRGLKCWKEIGDIEYMIYIYNYIYVYIYMYIYIYSHPEVDRISEIFKKDIIYIYIIYRGYFS